MALQDPALRSAYDLKVPRRCLYPAQMLTPRRYSCSATPTSCSHVEYGGTSRNGVELWTASSTSCACRRSSRPHVDDSTRRYLRFVKPAYDNFVLPSSRYADIVRNCGSVPQRCWRS